jgi:hypothetical protein
VEAVEADVVAAEEAVELPALAVGGVDVVLSMVNTLPSATGADATRRNRPIPARLP